MARRRPAEPTANPVRGAALVVVAVLVGLFLLRNGLDTTVEVTSNGSPAPPATDDAGDVDDVDDDAVPGDDDPGDDLPPTTEAVRDPADVRVIVLNGSGVAGAAGRWSDGIEAYGYQMLEPGNAESRVPVTQVLHQEGFEAEAEAVVAAMGAPGGVTAAPLGAEPPGEIGDASVVVVVGPDIAEGDPPAPGGAPDGGDEGDEGTADGG